MVGNLTQKGIENIKNSPNRVEDARKMFQSLGGDIKDFYYTMGKYDFILISEFPNDDAATRAILINGMKGSARTETLKAITLEEMVNIVKELP